MLEKIRNLVRESAVCVLATASRNRPHTSLMVYAADAEGRRFFMATHAGTRKYRNLLENPEVSLLVDNRCAGGIDEAMALTVSGSCRRLVEPVERQVAKSRLLARHPHLSDFLQHPEAELICVTARSFNLLSGLTQAHYVDLEESEGSAV